MTLSQHSPLHLAFGFTFDDLYDVEGLHRLQETFENYLNEEAPLLCAQYLAFQQSEKEPEKEDATFYLEMAPYIETFLGRLFSIEEDIQSLQHRHAPYALLYQVKRQFIQRRVLRQFNLEDIKDFDGLLYEKNLTEESTFSSINFAEKILSWLQDEVSNQVDLENAAKYCAWAVLTEEGQSRHKNTPLFQFPKKQEDPLHRLHVTHQNERMIAHLKDRRARDGFVLTDPGPTRDYAMDQAFYCIHCHRQGKDSCRKGMAPKTSSLGTGEEKENSFAQDPFGIFLTGCPLEQKISEMNEAKSKGYTVAALTIGIIDNPMIAGTGHRICNDCLKACIYQKQDAVNIPSLESQILSDVLELPWGFEIYSLLTRWNPLKFKSPVPKKPTGYKVLVVGAGPAGITLSHYLLNEGHTVVAIDGLKIEPLPSEVSGRDPLGKQIPFQPIYRTKDLWESLDDRLVGGFGGVAEYGITVRWDKNNLKILRLLLERRHYFSLIGGVRFGGTLTPELALSLGFHHISLCMGAGSPTQLSLPNGRAPGVRQASDFLMALQLTGAGQLNSLANLQIKMPIVIIGGGLTAIDTATEAMAYYPRQVEKFYLRYKELEKEDLLLLNSLSIEGQDTWQTFLDHGAAVHKERLHASQEGRLPNFIPLMEQWGGVTLIYRRKFHESPSYRYNHEEVQKALEEGIAILEEAAPLEILVNEKGWVRAVRVQRPSGKEDLPAGTVFVAAGTQPNRSLRHDLSSSFPFHNAKLTPLEPGILFPNGKPKEAPVLLCALSKTHYMSFFGDMHPGFSGNVVKAMASAKHGYKDISTVLSRLPKSSENSSAFLDKLNYLLRPVVQHVTRLTPTIVEITLQAPLAAQQFRPGQFYRLQNFQALCPRLDNLPLAMEGLALTGASVGEDKTSISTIVLEMGGSSSLCKYLKPGEPVVFMGPTGSPTPIPSNQKVILMGGGLGNAVLFSIGAAMKKQGCEVIYFAGYKKRQDRYKVFELEEAANQLIWCCDEAPGFIPGRAQDISFVGNMAQALSTYCEGSFPTLFSPQEAEHVMVIGSDGLMGAIAHLLKGPLKPSFPNLQGAYGSINAPMQCMMKEICAQCLQRQVDPLTGEETYVYSCVNQDQLLDDVDFLYLHNRLQQNRQQEILTSTWLKKVCRNLPPQ